MNNRDKSYEINSVQNLLDVVEALSELDSIGVTDLASVTGLSKNNTFRLLRNLQDRGYVTKSDETDKYRLTSKFNVLGARIALTQGNRIQSLLKTLGDVVSEASVDAGLLPRKDQQ
jgi:DNA-binding IclR family transcriptional regulator